MPQVSFDTHDAIRKLQQAGCPPEQAEAMVAIVTAATGLTAQIVRDLEWLKLQVETRMATKDDLAALRTETLERLAALRTETQEGLAGLRAETQEGLAALRTETLEGLAALRTETQEGLAGLRGDIKGDVAGVRADAQADIAEHRAETRAGFAELRARLDKVEERMVTKGDLYRALWIQGGVLATLILSLAGMTLGFALYALTGS
ncbi:coiled-coil domain-containing protein [Candidatus Foliamicus sp.]